MNRKQKIIVSVIGIFIVLLALVGITYGYFLTRIQGNINTTSIGVTTANLILEYSDNGFILGSDVGVIIPDSNNPIGTKTFTVTNKGNSTVDDYGIYLEDFYVVYANNATLEDGTQVTKGQLTKLNSPEDMKLVITCKAFTNYGENNQTEIGECENDYDGSLPTTNSLLLTNGIEVGVTHEYLMTLTYLETGIDQSADMNKTLNGLIQIYNQKDVVDIEGTVTGADSNYYVQIESYPKLSQIVDGKFKLVGVELGEHTVSIVTVSNDGTVTKQAETEVTVEKGEIANGYGTTLIIDNYSQTAKATLIYSNTDKTVSVSFDEKVKLLNPYKKGTLAYSIFSNDLITKNTTIPKFTGVATEEEGMYPAEDDYGTSWYFRGAQPNNYVNFAGFTWRIVRINGDGSVRLILDGTLDKVKREGLSKVAGTTSKFNSLYNNNAYVGYMYGIPEVNNDYVCVINNNGVLSIATTIKDKASCTGDWMTGYEATHMNLNDSIIKDNLDLFYENYIENETSGYHYGEYLSDTLFCGDKTLASNGKNVGFGDNQTYYAAYKRLSNNGNGISAKNPANPTLKCAENADNTYSRYTVKGETTNKGIETNGDLTYPLALLSADELVMAGAWGGSGTKINKLFYLYDAYAISLSASYWWTMSPNYCYGTAFEFLSEATSDSFGSHSVRDSLSGVRPVINLKYDVLWAGGNGTSGNGAYTVKLTN